MLQNKIANFSAYPNIVVRPPGPKARELIKKDEIFISPSYGRFYPLVVESGEGCIIKDVDGNEYIDFNSGLVCLNVGHNHPRVINAIKTQCDRFLHYSNTDFYYREVVDLAEKLAEITPGRFEKKVYFGNSGTEAVEAAVKVSKWHTRKHRFIAFTGAFHGRTLGSLSFTASKTVQRRHFFPLLSGVTHVPYPYCYRCPFKLSFPDCDYWCIDFIDEMVLQKYIPPEEVAGIIFEPIQGEGGYVVPPPGYFQRLKKLADKYGLLLIDDEVQAGIGRTGRWFAIEHWGVEPEVICIAKSIASGLPLGAIVTNSKLMDWEPGSHASTFGGNPLSCMASLATIKAIQEEKLLENATKQGRYIMQHFEELQDETEIIGDVRGKGLMIGVEIVNDKTSKKPDLEKAYEIMIRSWRSGVAIITCGRSTLRLAPPLTITRELIDTSIQIIEHAIKSSVEVSYYPSHELERPIPSIKIRRPRSQVLVSKLSSCPLGFEGWKEYEEIGREILEYLLVPPLGKPWVQARTEGRLHIRDLVFPILYDMKGERARFWFIQGDRYIMSALIVDFKNRSSPITGNDVVLFSKYLGPHRLGNFGIIFSRLGPQESATKEAKRIWREDHKLILCLSDSHLKAMINFREKRIEPEKIVETERLKFLMSLE